MSLLRRLTNRTILAPPVVRHSSQTLYQALLGCCRLWHATGKVIWRRRAEKVVGLLLSIQQQDGGFDIGYDFDFGLLHRRGQSTSPELLALIALCEYSQLSNEDSIAEAAQCAANWIRAHARRVTPTRTAIPYSPKTTDQIMVYNGTSFACAALGCYLARYGGDTALETIYTEMIAYLDDVMSTEKNLPGRFWFYNNQLRTDLDPLKRIKVDYYHQMQQVEAHALAQQVSPHAIQATIIQDAADHVVAVSRHHTVVPYTNDNRFFGGTIHLWGLSSVVSGLLEAARTAPSRESEYHDVAKRTLDWILHHGWNGRRFWAVLSRDGDPAPPHSYMVRSDAWVFNSLAAAALHLGRGPWTDVAETCYRNMESVDFSGPESHASNRRIRMVKKSWMTIKGLSQR